jgi:hypothetical protein
MVRERFASGLGLPILRGMFGRSRLARFLNCTLLVSAALGFEAGCTCGSGPYQGDYFDGDRPDPIKNVKFVESEKGDPKIVGCADGQREGFAVIDKHPRIAGCIGEWSGSRSLRDKPTGKACGDDGAKCTVPADLCAEGWHVCGFDGSGEDLREDAKAKDCDAAGPGRFNAAVSHSPSDEIDPCPKITKSTVLPCIQSDLGSEPVCCGNDCLSGKCKDGVWKGRTRISRGTTEGCGAVTSERNPGVLCCYSGEGNPADAVGEGKAEDTAEGESAEGESGKEGKDGEAGDDGKTAADAKGDDGKKDDGAKDKKPANKAEPEKADDKKAEKKAEKKADAKAEPKSAGDAE